MKSSAWYAKFPMDAYALGPFRFDKPVSEKEARAYIRQCEGVTRLVGVSVWATN